jgi:two-component system, NtrC family, sensor kinase
MKNIFIRLIFFTHLLSVSITVIAQNNHVDSLKKVLATEKEDTSKVYTLCALSWATWKDSVAQLQYAQDALHLAQKTSFIKAQAVAYRSLSIYYAIHKNPDSALRNAFISVKLHEDINDKPGTAFMYKYIGDYYDNPLSNLPQSLVYLYKALKLYEELEDKKSIAYCLYQIGAHNYWLENYDESFKNYQQCLQLSKQLNYAQGIIESNFYIGNYFSVKKNYRESLKYDSITLRIADSLSDKAGIAGAHSGIGINLEKLSENEANKALSKSYLNDAIKNYLIAMDFYKDFDIGSVGDTYSRLGKAYTELHNFPEAKKYFQLAVQTGNDIVGADNLKTAYEGFSKLDSLEGNYADAYKHYKLFITYRDSVFNEKNTKKIVQSQMQYDFDKKEATAKAAQDIKDAETKRIKNQQYFAIGALGIVVLAVIIIALIQFRNNKQKQKANNLITKQKQQVEATLTELKSTQSQLIQSEKMASLGELTAGIAHEIQNPLNFVNNFSEVNKELIEELKQEAKSGNNNEVIAIANDISANEEKINHHGKRADAIVKGMLQHSRSSSGVKESTDINTLADEYLRLAYHGLRAKDKDFNAEIETDFDNLIGKINIIPQDIGRVLLNLYNNAFYAVNEKKKTADANYEPTVSVVTKKSGNQISITVKDNGNGISQKVVGKIFQPFFTTKPTGQGTGLGLSLSYDIIKAHGGEIRVNTSEGEFTEFIIQLPA